MACLQICWLKTLFFSLLFFSPPLSWCWICSVAVPLCHHQSSVFLTLWVFIEHALSISLLWYDKTQLAYLFTFVDQKFNIRQRLVGRAFLVKFPAVKNVFSTSDTKAFSLSLSPSSVSLALPFVAAWPLGSFGAIFCHACLFHLAML